MAGMLNKLLDGVVACRTQLQLETKMLTPGAFESVLACENDGIQLNIISRLSGDTLNRLFAERTLLTLCLLGGKSTLRLVLSRLDDETLRQLCQHTADELLSAPSAARPVLLLKGNPGFSQLVIAACCQDSDSIKALNITELNIKRVIANLQLRHLSALRDALGLEARITESQLVERVNKFHTHIISEGLEKYLASANNRLARLHYFKIINSYLPRLPLSKSYYSKDVEELAKRAMLSVINRDNPPLVPHGFLTLARARSKLQKHVDKLERSNSSRLLIESSVYALPLASTTTITSALTPSDVFSQTGLVRQSGAPTAPPLTPVSELISQRPSILFGGSRESADIAKPVMPLVEPRRSRRIAV
ncbi:MAG: hypothetical protein A3E84_01835 [Gammaproteobacteria bacterium RIFCSPHIGHO2_12_FULL_42_13]|nr:MAG: hypothetical protein A3E84_01835 [Gammaproteobacteria bacterium RIFCSPHIGHO2_12_FULL_42_13]